MTGRKLVRAVSAGWLVLVMLFGWGYVAGRYEVFPFGVIGPLESDLVAFVRGHPDEPETSVLQKLASDFGGIPHRFAIPQRPALDAKPGTTSFHFAEFGTEVSGWTMHPPPGFLLVGGAFNFDGSEKTGVLLISTAGQLIRHWRTWNIGVGMAVDEGHGYILVNDNLQRLSWCDRTAPVAERMFMGAHHSVELAPDGTYWTADEDDNLVQLVWTGEEDRELEVRTRINVPHQLPKVNTNVSPLSPRFALEWDDKNDPQKTRPLIGFLDDPFHLNDVQPFVDPRFSSQMGYMLLVSAREPNLIFALDPASAEIVWFIQGLTERQHDVDYFDGDLFVYNNRPFQDASTIERIEFEASKFKPFGMTTVVDGGEFGWFDPSRGFHQVFSYDGRVYHLLVNDRRGRVYMIDAERGEPVFVLQNNLGDDSSVQLRTALYFDEEQYERLEQRCKS